MIKIGRYVIMPERELMKMVYRDHLTGLPNRKMFDESLELLVAEAERRGDRVGLLFMDLNGFKRVNDRLGHSVGDQVLQIFAGSLVKAVRRSDVVARFGGDEFAVILPNIKGPGDLKRVADKLATLTEQPFSLAGKELWLSPSIGGSIYPDNTTDVADLVKLADKAMYRVKADLSSHYLYHGHMSQVSDLKPGAD